MVSFSSRSPDRPGSRASRPCLAALFVVAAVGCVPTVESFSASEDSVGVGETVKLSWKAKDASGVTLEPGGLTGDASGSVELTPLETTTYTLTATGGLGQRAVDTLTVTVTPRFSARGGTYNGSTLGTVYTFALAEIGGAAVQSETEVTVTRPGGSSETFGCPAGERVCVVVREGDTPASGTYQASAEVAGQPLESSFAVSTTGLLPKPSPITATVTSDTTVDASWPSLSDAESYRAWIADRNTGLPAGPVETIAATDASLTSDVSLASGSYQIVVEGRTFADPNDELPPSLEPERASRATTCLGGAVTASSDWQRFGPDDYCGDTLQVTHTNLGPTERLAVLVMNVEGTDGVSTPNASIGISGTFAAAAPDAIPPSAQSADFLASPAQGREWHRRLDESEAKQRLSERLVEAVGSPTSTPRTAPVRPLRAPAVEPESRSFCVNVNLTGNVVKKDASLVKETATVAFYVDDDDAGDYTSHEPAIWDDLAADWEDIIYPTVTGVFGAESDVDGNGKLLVFLSSDVGAPSGGSIILGYYWGGDVVLPKDDGCIDNGSNDADMFYLNSLGNIQAAGYSAADAIERVYPDTLAHEFQHLINFNQRCVLQTCTFGDTRETWINEGLSMVAEDLVGFGWHETAGRQSGRQYLDRMASSYDVSSLTIWEGQPIGNYQGSHAFFLYLWEQYGDGILTGIAQNATAGLPKLEAETGRSFGSLFADWTTALMFSNEAFSPDARFDFTGASWTPFHQKLRYLNYVPLDPGASLDLRLRQNGWNAFLTGVGATGDAQIAVTGVGSDRPEVVVVRFSGSLPND